MTDLPAKREVPKALAHLLADTLQDRLNRLDPHSRRSYERGLNQFVEWLAEQGLTDPPLQVLNELGARGGNLLVEAYLAHLLYGPEPYARATVEVRLAALKWAVREAYSAAELTWQLVARMPKPRKGEDGRLLEKGGRKMTGPTPQEAIDMLAACGTPRERLIFLMCRVEGYRIHEIRQINYEDLRGREISMVRKKRGKADAFRLSGTTYAALQEYLEVRGTMSGPLFIGKKGRRSVSDMYRTIVRIGDTAGVPGMSPHRVRHRACTDIVRYCVQNRIPEEEILRLTGHGGRKALRPYYEHDIIDASVAILDGVSNMYDENGNPRDSQS